ncbi:hypothetical protein BDN70DRAFT_925430 [Pholiota conissans]|uniref:Uncharacterized protein n=1 Tax=Pholiota conissans TaxID=109636 RepID=A0A9P5YSK6_9AGAR|nr:hypothetical protein BDN70DRAFT_925430 [Pholiota conissans]
MLIILLFFTLFQTLRGVPLSSPTNPLDDFSTFCPRATDSHFGQRTVNDIVISCFATIFACTWSAIHPNIPAPTDCWWTRFKRQVITMICALLAPELITYWALEQRLAAREIMEEYNKEILKDSTSQPTSILERIKRLFRDSSPPASSKSSANRPQWTLTHGFFLQMGGFMLSDDGMPTHILIDGSRSKTPKELQLIHNIKEGVISPPRITEEDIQDRSKGDIISKTIIILQTTWFAVQCLARWSQHLPLTELEIVTLGFAMLNGITYALWWNKPQNVGRPVFLEREGLTRASSEIPEAIDQPAEPTTAENIAGSSHEPETERQATLEHPTRKQEGFLTRILRKSRSAIEIIVYLQAQLLRPLRKLIDEGKVHRDRVSVFYRSELKDEHDTVASIIVLVIGILFGGVHLIPGWFLDFASSQEKWLWRTSAIIITVAPIPIGMGFILEHINALGTVVTIAVGATVVICFLYPFARIILLIISFTSLRSLSPATLQTIEWTTFIPHL